MSQSAIVHEWFCPEGPDTFEYPFPISGAEVKPQSALTEWLREFLNLTGTEARIVFQEYLATISTPQLSPLIRVLESLEPYSVVVHESDSWLLCKVPAQLHETSSYGNMLLLPSPAYPDRWPVEFDLEIFNSLKDLLVSFGGMRLDIPPTCGLAKSVDLKPAIEDETTKAWANIGFWTGSYPVFNVGNGDVVLVRADGTYGRWNHELADEQGGAVSEVGSFSDFIQFVIDQLGICS